MILVTLTLSPPSWAAMLPHTFSAATTRSLPPWPLAGGFVSQANSPNVTAPSSSRATQRTARMAGSYSHGAGAAGGMPHAPRVNENRFHYHRQASARYPADR